MTAGAELLLWLLAVVLPLGIGYWCMTISRGKGRSVGGGFALGFLLTHFLSLLDTVVALVISATRAPANCSCDQLAGALSTERGR